MSNLAHLHVVPNICGHEPEQLRSAVIARTEALADAIAACDADICEYHALVAAMQALCSMCNLGKRDT